MARGLGRLWASEVLDGVHCPACGVRTRACRSARLAGLPPLLAVLVRPAASAQVLFATSDSPRDKRQACSGSS